MAEESRGEREQESKMLRERQNGVNIIKWKWREEVNEGIDETD